MYKTEKSLKRKYGKNNLRDLQAQVISDCRAQHENDRM